MIALLAALANAQDAAIDGHGFNLVPGEGASVDLLATVRPGLQKPQSFAVDALFEYADEPLVLFTRDDDVITRQGLVESLLGVNLGARYSVSEKFGFSAAMPVYFSSVDSDGPRGFAGGDLRLAAPTNLVFANGLGFATYTFLDLPTGAGGRFLGGKGMNAGITVAPGYATERMSAAVNFGITGNSASEFYNLGPGLHLTLGGGFGYAIAPDLGLRAEVHALVPTGKNEVAGTDSPAEVLLSAKGTPGGSGVSWTAGGAKGISRGAGAADFRVFAGIGFARTPAPPPPDTDGDGLIDAVDGCPTVPETVNGWKDEDGCADSLAGLTVKVVDEDGKPVPDAVVTIGGVAGLSVAAQTPESSLAVHVEHPWFQTADQVATLAEGDNELVVHLLYRPAAVKIIARTETSEPIDARVRLDGPVPMDIVSLGADGNERIGLHPGSWRILVSADSFGTERRDLQIEPGAMSLITIEVEMHPTLTIIEKSEIKILEQVHFDFDKDTIKPESFGLLDQVANVLLDHPDLEKIEVQGHTDDKGKDAYNLDLSQRRVESVRSYLISKGVAEERLVAVGYGETKPIGNNKTEAGRAQNRRVQFVILDPAPPAPE